MYELLIIVFAISLIGSLLVPIGVLTLAHFGVFEPIEFQALGRRWQFPLPPKIRMASAVTPEQTWFFSGVTAMSATMPILIVVTHLHISSVRLEPDRPTALTQSDAAVAEFRIG